MVVLGLVLSLAIGLSLGLLGGGGSILTVPVLHYTLGFAAHDAIAGSLLVVAVTSSVALVPHARAHHVQWRIGVIFGVASIATAFLGGRLGARLPGGALLVAFAVVMIAAGVAMLVRSSAPGSPPASTPVRAPRIVAAGLAVGLLTGVLGAGGGFLIVPALMWLAGLALEAAVGTSLFVIALNALAGLVGSASVARADVGLVVAVTALAVAGSLVGARLGRRLPAPQVQRVFGGFVLAVAALILLRELVSR